MDEFNEKNGKNETELLSDMKFEKNGDGDMERSVIWKDGGGTHTETTIIHKNVPAVGTILTTAITFLLVGMLVAGVIFLARYGNYFSKSAQTDKETATQAPATVLPTLEPIHAGSDLPTQAPNPGGNSGGDPTSSIAGIPELYSRNVLGVVIIESYSGSVRPSNLVGTGTGFCISANGYILTNAHVVNDADHFMVTAYNKNQCEASLIGADKKTDIAVLKIEETNMLSVLTVGDSSKVRTGDFVFTIGHPTGDELSFTATFGMVGAVERSVVIDGLRNSYIQIDAAINPGNSGGPLFDMNGNVIGVNSAKTVIASYDEDGNPINAEGLGFAIPIGTAMDVAREIINDGGIERPGIGVSTIYIDEDRANTYSIPTGALVYTVIENGPAHLGGLKVDDIITAVDGVAITSNDVLGEYIRTKSIGDIITMSVFRDGETLEVQITIGDFNQIGSKILNDEYGGAKYGINGVH